MAITGILEKAATFLIIIFFLMGVYEATNTAQTEIPVYQSAFDSAMEGNVSYIVDVALLGWGWSMITPSINVDSLPWYLAPYGWYSKIIIPEGYLPLPGFESFVFIGLVFLAFLPFGMILRRRRTAAGGGFLKLPLWFWLLIPLAILLLYPVWCWVHIHWIFIPGAMGAFGITQEEAYAIWLNFSENSESFTWFFVFMTVLGLYKGGRWGLKMKKF